MGDKVNQHCKCANTTCARHGKCAECKKFHAGNGSLTNCQQSRK